MHGDQVVELSVLLEVHEKGEVEEDGEGQIEVEGEDELVEGLYPTPHIYEQMTA